VSEAAELLLLKEKLDEIKRSRWVTQIIVFVLVIIISIAISDALNLDFVMGLIFVVVFGFSTSVAVDFYYNREKEKIVQQIKGVATANRCPKCKMPIPSGDFAFCPFCGASLGSGVASSTG